MRLAPQRRLPLSTQLVGVDGGATHVRAVHVEVEPAPGGAVRVHASGAERKRAHRQVLGFETPAELGLTGPEQLGPIGAAEREQGWAWVESTARCVLELARERGAARVLLGIAFPGRKTADARGIEFALNGPRVPQFLEQLEQLLRSEGLEFDGELLGLQSDGWCAGVGEAHADDGGLRGVRDAYYVGGGTGLAEALCLRGELVDFAEIEDWFPRGWRMQWDGAPLESWVSASGINRRWADSTGFGLPLEPGKFPEDRVQRDPRARELLEQAGEALGQLVSHRLVALQSGGRPESGHAGPIRLERVLVGAQLGRMLADPRTQGSLRRAFEARLDEGLRRTGLDALYPPDGGRGMERREFVKLSRLAHPAAIGAAVEALSKWGGRG